MPKKKTLVNESLTQTAFYPFILIFKRKLAHIARKNRPLTIDIHLRRNKIVCSLPESCLLALSSIMVLCRNRTTIREATNNRLNKNHIAVQNITVTLHSCVRPARYQNHRFKIYIKTMKLITAPAKLIHPALNFCWNIRNIPKLNNPKISIKKTTPSINNVAETPLTSTNDTLYTPLYQFAM